MSNYDRLLEEAKKQGANLAKNYVPELYKILVEEEKLEPKDAGDRIKKDLVLIWSIQTINKNLPEEAKHTEKDPHEKNVTEEYVKPVSHTIIEQTTNGTTLPATTVPDFEPVTDKPNNDQFGKGVVPMTNEEEKPILKHSIRLVMSEGQFSGLAKGMLKKHEENGWKVDYAIEYDAKERALYLDVAEKGEQRDIDD